MTSQPRAALYQQLRRAGWPPAAARYHQSTWDVPVLEGDRARAYDKYLEQRATIEDAPESFKKLHGRGIGLPRVKFSGEFVDVLLSRRTWRGFGTKALRASDLGTLLDLTFGSQMIGIRQGVKVMFRTSPAGGACHPIEAYVLVRRVQDVAPGLYHFAPRNRRLHSIKPGASSRRISSYLGGQSWFGNAAALVLMTAVMPRVWWRYPHANSYRAVLLEAGHFCQTFCLVATWLGLAPFCTMALDDARVERDLGIDGVNEILLYAAGVGTRPADGRWVQWPGHRPDIALPDARRHARARKRKAVR